jgi:hypothetical protein
MKRAVTLGLAGLILVSAVLYFPISAAGHDVAECYRDHETCRELAFNMNASWVRVALTLTLCDIALGKCILAVKA